MKTLTISIALAILLTSCKAPTAPQEISTDQLSSNRRAQNQAKVKSLDSLPISTSQSGRNSMDSPLAELLKTFLGAQGGNWSVYNAVQSITWRDQVPVAAAYAGSSDASHKREGELLLSGFAETDLPNGKVGAEAGSQRGNEGESGLTLFGTADAVLSLAVMKFYPSDDYSEILGKQFFGDVALQLIAENCGDDESDPEARQFLRLHVPSAGTAYVEAYVDAEGGKYSPGSTTFEFYRTEPLDRIQRMKCKRL